MELETITYFHISVVQNTRNTLDFLSVIRKGKEEIIGGFKLRKKSC